MNESSIFKAMFGVWLVFVVVYLALIAGVVYVAGHFLGKYW